MNLKNRFGIEPGVYEDPSGVKYVVTDIVTHSFSPAGDHQLLTEPLVIMRDLSMSNDHKSYWLTISEFNSTVYGKQRFFKQ